MNQDVVLEIQNISKSYPGVHALKAVSFNVIRGTVHCLVGENGAGKSTLIKILAGAEQPDSGQVILNGTPVSMRSINEAHRLGLSFIFQEINVVEQLTVADNFTLGNESGRFGLWTRKRDVARARDYLQRLNMDIDPSLPMARLSVAQKQMVEIARALSVNASIIVMDEPSAPLTEHELEALFDTITRLRSEGVTIIYVSHRLAEIFKIGDNCTVLRDGEHISTGPLSGLTPDRLIQLMVGRDLKNMYTRTPTPPGKSLLELKNVSLNQRLRNISLTLHENEILGVAGLAGAGRTELANLIFGVTPATSGDIYIDGKRLTPSSPREAIRLGIGLVPEERRTQGIVGVMSVRENISLALSRLISQWGIINRKLDQNIANQYIDDLQIRTPHAEQRIALLSGGNQQKVVLARWLATQSRILLLDEPTRGIDVGAKAEVFALVNQLATRGHGILLFSSEMEELLSVCDRILVINRGQIVAEFPRTQATQELILQYAASDLSELAAGS